MAVGVLGGTFNPVHIGHLRGAIYAREVLCLHQVKLLPAAIPPLKATPTVSAEHRAAMLDLATADIPGVSVDRRELTRTGPSYTVDTLAELRSELGAECPLIFVLGADSLANLHRWYAWQNLFQFASIAVLARPGSAGSIVDARVADFLAGRTICCGDLLTRPSGFLSYLPHPPPSISSTDIRQAIANGENVQFLLPPSVIEYIRRYDLYDFSQASHRGSQ